MSLNISTIKNNTMLKIKFQNQITTLNANPYNKIGEIKEIASNRFYNIRKKDIHIYYKNQDLKDKEKEEIGEFFSNQKIVPLKLDYPENNINTFSSKKNTLYENKELNNHEYKITHIYTSPNHLMSLKKFNAKHQILPKLNIYKTRNIENFLTNSDEDKIIEKNKPIKINDNSPIIRKTIKKMTVSPYKSSFNQKIKNNNQCSSCNNKLTSYFCRNCQKFLCSKCRENSEHNSHLMIRFSEKNLIESVELYANILETDIEENIIQIENFLISFQEKNFNIDIENKQNMIIKKLKNLTNLYISLIHLLENKYLNEETEKNIDEYISKTKEISINIKDILRNFNKNKNKLDEEEIKNYFKLINDNENKYNILNKNILIYNINNNINHRINTFFEEFNNNIDKLLNPNTIFNLDKKSVELIHDFNFFEKSKNINFDEDFYKKYLSKSRDDIKSILKNKNYHQQSTYSNEKSNNLKKDEKILKLLESDGDSI